MRIRYVPILALSLNILFTPWLHAQDPSPVPLGKLGFIPDMSCATATIPPPNPTNFSCVVSICQNIFPANTATTAVLQVVLNAPGPSPSERPAINLCLVLDGSGSMKGPKLQQMKDAAGDMLHQLGAQDWISVIVLGKRLQTLIPSQAAKDIPALQTKIQGIEAEGGTSLFSGLSRAATELRKHREKAFVNRILLLSDGAANEGPSSARLLERLGLSLLKENISVSTVGIGEAFNEDLLSRIADKSDGNFHLAEELSKLPAVFRSEMTDLTTIVAQDVDLNITCLRNVNPIEVVGRDGSIEDQKVSIAFNQLYAGQNRAFLKVEVGPNAPAADIPIAQATAEFRNGLTFQVQREEAWGRVGFSTNRDDIADSQVAEVAENAALVKSGLVQEQAIWNYREGNVEAAQQMLNANLVELQNTQNYDKNGFLQQQAVQIGNAEQQLKTDNTLTDAMQRRMYNDAFKLKRSNTRGGVPIPANPAP